MENKSGKCTSCKHRIDPGGWAACDGCIHDEGLKDRYEPMTSADRIRNMTDEELAKSIVRHFLLCKKCFFKRRCEKDPTGVCIECVLTFLRSPVEATE